MSKGRLYAAVLGVFVCASPVAQGQEPTKQEPPAVSLDEFIRRAVDSSPVMSLGRAELANYEAIFDQAYYAWVPTVKVESILAPLPERRLLRECVLPGQLSEEGFVRVGPCPGELPEDDEKIEPDTEIGILTRTKAQLTLPIYTFGKIDAAQRAARQGVEVGRAGVDEARSELVWMVKRAYYGTQLAQSALAILKDGQKRFAKARKDIEKELDKESGRFTRNDLRKLQIQEADVQSGFLETDQLSQLAWEGLRLAGGFEPGEAFALDTFELQPVNTEPRTFEAYYDLALGARPDVRMVEAGVRAREGQVGMATANFFPDIALVAAFGFARGTTAEDNPDPFASDAYNFLNWGVVLGAEWKIDIAGHLSKLHQAEASLAKMRAQRDALVQKVRLDVLERVGLMQRYAGELDSRQVAMKAAKGWLVSNSMNFGAGLASADELVDSLVAYSKGQLKYFQTIYEYNLAVARLSDSVGTELVVPGVRQSTAEASDE